MKAVAVDFLGPAMGRGRTMRVRGLLGASALALSAVVGSDSVFGPARSFTIPSVCTDAAKCAAICSGVGEAGQTEADFIQLAAYQLGPEKPIDLPPANLSMPAPVDPKNVYAGAGAGMFSPAVAGHLSRVYSPNLITGKVDVIDPETFKVIESLTAIPSPEHIVPSWDLQTLWVSGDISYRGGHADVMPIDPKTGKLGKAIDVPDSYNLYFTPDGKSAIMVAEAMRRLEFRDPHTMDLQGYIDTPQCAGINHADFSPDGSYAIFTCEYNDALAKIDLVHHKLVETLPLTPGHMPQDIRVAPDGKAFFVADLIGDGLVVIDGDSSGRPASSPRASARTAFIPAATARSSMSPTAAPTISPARETAGAACRWSTSPPARSSPTGPFRAAAARTWATSAPTANGCGCRAATTASSTPSTPRTAR